MTEQIVKTVHTTTTTTTTTAGSGVQFRFAFIKSIHGLVIFLEFFYAFIAFVVIMAGTDDTFLGGSFAFFIVATLVCWVYSGFTYVCLLLTLRSKIRLPWHFVDIGMYAFLLLLTIIASSLVLSNGVRKAAGSAGTLGFVVAQLYFVSLGLAIQDYRYMRSMNAGGQGAMSQGTQDVPNLGY